VLKGRAAFRVSGRVEATTAMRTSLPRVVMANNTPPAKVTAPPREKPSSRKTSPNCTSTKRPAQENPSPIFPAKASTHQKRALSREKARSKDKPIATHPSLTGSRKR